MIAAGLAMPRPPRRAQGTPARPMFRAHRAQDNPMQPPDKAEGGRSTALSTIAMLAEVQHIVVRSVTRKATDAKESKMKSGIDAAVLACACGLFAAANAAEPLKVDTQGVTARILFEAPIDGGHLAELKGKYKLRITEIAIAPGGYVGDHNHVGPGIRQMTLGEMEYVMPHKTTYYRAGDFFFETGDISHHVNNKTRDPNKHLLFEILPVDLKGPSLILPKDKPAHQ